MTKLLLAAGAALALASPAFAAPLDDTVAQQQPNTRVVSTSGVNFGDQTEVRRFYHRLYTAAAIACDAGEGHVLVPITQDQTCIRENMANAARAVNAPLLTAMVTQVYGPVDSRATAFAIDAR